MGFIQDRGISDVELTEDFLVAYDKLSDRVKKAVDKIINFLSYGVVTNGMNVHRAENSENFFIYVKQGSGGYRLLITFRKTETGVVVVVLDVFHHDEMRKRYG